MVPDIPDQLENQETVDGPSDGDLWFGVLGPVQVLAGGHSLPLGSPGLRGLLFLLVLGANQVVPIDRIVDGLWGERPPATARTIVHGYVSRLRRVLAEVDPGGGTATILTRTPGYELRVEESRIDLARARRLLAAARGQPAGRRAELLRSAAALWRGPLQVDPPVGSVLVEVADLRLVLTAERVEAELELGRHAELVGELRGLVRAHPFDEVLVGQLIRALHGSGLRAEALERYHEFRRGVADELGIDPGPQLRQLHGLLLRDELTPPPAPALGAPIPAQLPAAATGFTGREDELAWLNGLLPNRAGSTVAVLTGTAGVGKSALAVTWGHRVAAEFPDGLLYAALRGFDPSQPPLAVTDVLPRFLLALGVRARDLPEDHEEQIALYRSVLAARRVLIVLDGARDSEHARPLLPGGPGAVALVTSRRRLDGLVASSGARLLRVEPLPPEPAIRLVHRAAADADMRLTAEQAARLAELCGYLPLALRVIAARLAAHPVRPVADLLAELADEHTRLAALDIEYADTSVRAALDVSYRGLHPAIGGAFRTLGLVPGPSVDPYATAALCGTDVPIALRRLRALAEANLVTERDGNRFVMPDLVRLYAKELTAIELSEPDRSAAFGRLLRYYLVTADRARRCLCPPSDELDFAGRAPKTARPTLDTAEHGLAWFDAEWANLTALLRATVAEGLHRDAWRLAALAAPALTVRPDYPDWPGWARTGLAAARAGGDADGEVMLLIVLAAVLGRAQPPAWDEALAEARHALRVATERDDARLIRTALDAVAGGLLGQGRLTEALSCARESHRLSVAAADQLGRAHAALTMAEVELALDRPAEAAGHARDAAGLFAEIGDPGSELAAVLTLAELHLATGRPTLARPQAERAVRLAERLSAGPATARAGRLLTAARLGADV
ncbi:MAG TPA: BTAD domain-containing putative transcriptional regulator [Pseudonocardiaceae bacterium]|nr:BTAD domain-containing putative transcriptional regulator [Pseudonocardiaceae bacterium]